MFEEKVKVMFGVIGSITVWQVAGIYCKLTIDLIYVIKLKLNPEPVVCRISNSSEGVLYIIEVEFGFLIMSGTGY